MRQMRIRGRGEASGYLWPRMRSGLFVADVHYNRIVGIVIRLALTRDSDGRAKFLRSAASVSVMPSSDTVKVVDHRPIAVA